MEEKEERKMTTLQTILMTYLINQDNGKWIIDKENKEISLQEFKKILEHDIQKIKDSELELATEYDAALNEINDIDGPKFEEIRDGIIASTSLTEQELAVSFEKFLEES
ncbi:hypothetical protein ACTGYW_00470 [Streptococcus suis]